MWEIKLQLHADADPKSTEWLGASNEVVTHISTSTAKADTDDAAKIEKGSADGMAWKTNGYQNAVLNQYTELIGEKVDYPKLLEKLTQAYKPQQTVDKIHNVIDVVGGCICNLQLAFTADKGQLGYGLASDEITLTDNGANTEHTQWYVINIPVATEEVAGLLAAADKKAMNTAYADIEELKEAMAEVKLALKKLGQNTGGNSSCDNNSGSGGECDADCGDAYGGFGGDDGDGDGGNDGDGDGGSCGDSGSGSQCDGGSDCDGTGGDGCDHE